MTRKEKPKSAPKATINEKLDEALDESFPASDPVSLGHSDHIGQPKLFQKKVGKLPAKSERLKGNPRAS